MTRIDLFVTADCPACPRARAVVQAFAERHPDVEVREWELGVDPGPAAGRGIFATPTLLLDGHEILVGFPAERDLAERYARAGGAAGSGQTPETGVSGPSGRTGSTKEYD